MQEANKGLSQEEKQALRKAKKAEKAQKATTPQQQKQQQPQQQPQQQKQKQQQKRQQQPAQQTMNKSNPNNHQPQLSGIPILGRLVPENTTTATVPRKGDISHIHMTFLRLSLLFSSREVRGASCRAEYLLKAIKELLASVSVLPNEESLNVCFIILQRIHPFIHPLTFCIHLSFSLFSPYLIIVCPAYYRSLKRELRVPHLHSPCFFPHGAHLSPSPRSYQ